MVWFPSALSRMCMGRGAGNQQVCACCEHARKRRQLSGPRVIWGSEWPGRGTELVHCVVQGEKKSTGVGPPSAPSRKWPDRGTWTEPLVLLTERSDITVLYSKSWSECYRRSLLACRCLVVSPLRCFRVLPMVVIACACPSST